MATQTNGMFLTKHDEWQYNSWSKEDIYKAYLVEIKARVSLNETVNKLNRQIAELRHDKAKAK